MSRDRPRRVGALFRCAALFQQYFDELQPRERAHALDLLGCAGAAPVRTGSNPLLSLLDPPGERRSVVSRLLTRGAGLDGTLGSPPRMWHLLRERQREALAQLPGRTPLTSLDAFRIHTASQVSAGRIVLTPPLHCLVERVAAYVGAAVRSEVPGARWGISDDGGLTVTGRGSVPLFERVLRQLRLAGADPEVPGQLDKRLAWLMVTWANGQYGGRPGHTPQP